MSITTTERLSVIFATWFGVGYSPKAPGTVGSLAAVLCAIPIVVLGGPLALIISACLASIIGIPVSTYAAKTMGSKDPSKVVIDEVAGQWIALIPAAPDLGSYCLAFIAFRLFDILKPGPIGWADRNLNAGWGIMTDDIFAGFCAAGVVYLLSPWVPPLYSFIG